MSGWQIVLLVLAFALWVWALVAVFIDLARRSDLSAGAKVAWIALVVLFPVGGVVVYFVARPRLTSDEREAVTAYEEAVDPNAEHIADRIAELARLRAEGAITDEEYEERKRQMN